MHLTDRFTLIPALATAATVIALAGCSGSPGADPPATTPLTTLATSPASTPASTSAASSPALTATTTQPGSTSTTSGDPIGCTFAQLQIALGQPGAAAGSQYQPIVFTNTGASACAMAGFPGVSFLTSAGATAGPAAARQGESGGPVSLAPGGTASALVQWAQAGLFPPERCGSLVTVASVRVHPPDATEWVDLPLATEACTNDVAQVHVEAVVTGQSGQAGQ